MSLLESDQNARRLSRGDEGKLVQALKSQEQVVKERVKLLRLQVQEEDLKKKLLLERQSNKHLLERQSNKHLLERQSNKHLLERQSNKQVAHETLYSQEAQDMYKQAEEYENEAREYYHKAQEAYWQAYSQASYEDWKRGQQEWEYWYNRPSIADKTPSQGKSSLQANGTNLAKTYFLAAAFTYFDRANKPTMKNWKQLTRTWDSQFANKAKLLQLKGANEREQIFRLLVHVLDHRQKCRDIKGSIRSGSTKISPRYD